MKAKHIIKVAVFALAVCACGLAPAAILSPGDILVADLGSDPSGTTPGGIFKVDPITGDRTIVTGFGVGSGPSIDDPFGITIDASGHILVVDLTKNSIFQVDPSSGNRTLVSGPSLGVGPELGTPAGIAVEQDGSLVVSTLYSHDLAEFADVRIGDLLRVNAATGDRSTLSSWFLDIGTGPVLGSPIDITIDANGQILLVESADNSSILQIDPQTGNRITLSGNGVGAGPSFDFEPLGGFPQGIALDANGQILVTDVGNSAIFRVDPASGDRTIVSGLVNGSGPLISAPMGIASGADGTIYATALDEATLFSIDPFTGDRTVFSSTGVGLGPDLFNPTYLTTVPVPEPSTMSLLATGMLFVVMVRWRRGLMPRR